MNKATCACALVILCCLNGWAQGALNFANAGADVNARLKDDHGEWLSGTGWVAQLWYYRGITGSEADLQPHPQTATFHTGDAAGYFTGGARTIQGAPGGSVITAQVRVWGPDALPGSTWNLTDASHRGLSALFQVTLTAPPNTPANLTGLQPFEIWYVPEPATGALLGLGIAIFAFDRKRRGSAR